MFFIDLLCWLLSLQRKGRSGGVWNSIKGQFLPNIVFPFSSPSFHPCLKPSTHTSILHTFEYAMFKLGVSKRGIISLGAVLTGFTLLFLYYITNDPLHSSNSLIDDDGNLMYASDSSSKQNNNNNPAKEQPKCLKDTASRDFIRPTKTQWEQCLEPGVQPSYYLSIVIVTRMDDYAG